MVVGDSDLTDIVKEWETIRRLTTIAKNLILKKSAKLMQKYIFAFF